MSQAVMIKSSKNGITLMLDAGIPFPDLFEEILKKFRESEKFFQNAAFAISFEGRALTEEEKYQIVNAIMTNTTVNIQCIIENDEIRDEVLKRKMEEARRIAQEDAAETSALPSRLGQRLTGSFYYGSLTPGENLETDSSIVVIGDIPPKAGIVSKGDIIVLGALKGSAYAGMDGNPKAFVAALEFEPEVCNIAGIYGNAAPQKKHSLFGKGNKAPQAKIAVAEAGVIHIRPIAGLDNYL